MGWFPSPGVSLQHFSERTLRLCAPTAYCQSGAVRTLRVTDSETAAIQTCLDTHCGVPPHPVLASGERMKLFDRQNES